LCHPGHYFSLDNDLIDHHAKTIGIIGVGLYTALARYANRKTGECWPSIGRLAHLLDCARSTIKIYLRKLVEVGLITITPRHDEAGDSTSHLYTLLDPSPTAIDRRHAAHAVAVVAVPEGGRLSADLPPAACQPTGRLPADPEPSSLEQKEENQPDVCSARGDEETIPQGNPCPHPIEERRHFGTVTLCCHCYALLDGSTAHAAVVAADSGGDLEVSCAARAA
jgi:hypothetical protein